MVDIRYQDVDGKVIQDTYDIQAVKSVYHRLLRLRDPVTFRTHIKDGVVIRPPSSVLLALHATCAQVAHLSGAAEVLDNLDNFWDDLDTDTDSTDTDTEPIA